jgi:hypothetical protein
MQPGLSVNAGNFKDHMFRQKHDGFTGCKTALLEHRVNHH